MVSRSEASSPPLTSSWMSSLASVPSSEWMRSVGVGARGPRRGTGASRRASASTAASSPGTAAAMRTAVRSGDTRPASGGASRGSTISAKVGSAVPSIGSSCARPSGPGRRRGRRPSPGRRSCRPGRRRRAASGGSGPRRAERAEQVVGPGRLVGRLLLAVVIDGVGGARPAERPGWPRTGRWSGPSTARTPASDGARSTSRRGRSRAGAERRRSRSDGSVSRGRPARPGSDGSCSSWRWLSQSTSTAAAPSSHGMPARSLSVATGIGDEGGGQSAVRRVRRVEHLPDRTGRRPGPGYQSLMASSSSRSAATARAGRARRRRPPPAGRSCARASP